MESESGVQQVGEFVVKVRQPAGGGPHPVIVMVHGWTGDENVMWIFARRLPQNAYLIAPRGLYPSGLGGYSWYPEQADGWPGIEDFRPAVDALLGILSPSNFPAGDFSSLRFVGFSQGAALVYSLALFYPKLVRALAGLSGFLPDGAQNYTKSRPLLEKPVFVAHGTLDERVPVKRARQAVELLETAGARVTYCEDEVGHKLSSTCFHGLEEFFARQESSG